MLRDTLITRAMVTYGPYKRAPTCNACEPWLTVRGARYRNDRREPGPDWSTGTPVMTLGPRLMSRMGDTGVLVLRPDGLVRHASLVLFNM